MRTVLALAAGCTALAVLLAAADVDGVPIALGIVALGLALGAALAAPTLRGADPALTTDGIRLKAYAWDRAQVLVPWTDVERLWIARTGAYDYLYVLPRDPDRYIHSGSRVRAAAMTRIAADQGSALQIYLAADGLPQDRIRSSVVQFSAGTAQVGPPPSAAQGE